MSTETVDIKESVVGFRSREVPRPCLLILPRLYFLYEHVSFKNYHAKLNTGEFLFIPTENGRKRMSMNLY